jgi:hypothetical protein
MSTPQTASEQITEEAASWPGVTAATGRRGEFAFRVGGREIGHLHGDHAAHFAFPKNVGARLREQGRIVDHPIFPGKAGLGARRITSQADIDDVIELLRFNYDRLVAKHEQAAEMPKS